MDAGEGIEAEEDAASVEEEKDTEDVENRDENGLDDVSGFPEDVAGVVVGDRREGSTDPTVIVVGIKLPPWCVNVVGMAMLDVAEASGAENEPDIPLRVKNGEKAI